MRKRIVFTETVDNFICEYVNWSFNDNENLDKWNYYIYFTEKNTTPELWKELLSIKSEEGSIRYYDSWISELDWHGGVTYASFERNSLQEICAIKAGCDYVHYYDEGRNYCLNNIIADCKNTIKSIKNKKEEK